MAVYPIAQSTAGCTLAGHLVCLSGRMRWTFHWWATCSRSLRINRMKGNRIQSSYSQLPSWKDHHLRTIHHCVRRSEYCWCKWIKYFSGFHVQKVWDAHKNATTDDKLHSVKPHLGYCSVTHLSRCDAAILRRLRIGHTRVTHKYLLSGDSQPLCDKCQCLLTVKHI